MTGLPVSDLVERSADPDRVRAALVRLEEQQPSLAAELAGDSATTAALVAVLAASRSLGRLLQTDRDAHLALHQSAPRDPVPATGMDALVAWKRRELLRIAARDLAGADSLELTTMGLSAMAIDVLAGAHRLAGEHLRSDDRLSVIAMGKLGSRGAELRQRRRRDGGGRGRPRPSRSRGTKPSRPGRPCLPGRRQPAARGTGWPARPQPRLLRGVLGPLGAAVGAAGAPEGGTRRAGTRTSAPRGAPRPSGSCGRSPSAPRSCATCGTSRSAPRPRRAVGEAASAM